MANIIQIFDVDGTLTYNYEDLINPPKTYASFAFWNLLSTQLVSNIDTFQTALQAWELSMKKETDVDASSFNMMEETVKYYLRKDITANTIQQHAKMITQDFIDLGIIQMVAIEYLRECLNKNIYCVLTTGSYLDGLQGFVKALETANLLPKSPYLILNGAEVSWPERKLLHANVGKFKVQKLQQSLFAKQLNPYTITAVFGDDPYVNDKMILQHAPKQCAFVNKLPRGKPRGITREVLTGSLSGACHTSSLDF